MVLEGACGSLPEDRDAAVLVDYLSAQVKQSDIRFSQLDCPDPLNASSAAALLAFFSESTLWHVCGRLSNENALARCWSN